MEPTIDIIEKTCPRCAEKIKLEARVCKFCGQEFTEAEILSIKQKIQEQKKKQAQATWNKERVTRHWGWILLILGSILTLLSGCLQVSMLISGPVDKSSTDNLFENFGFYIGGGIAKYCCFSPFIVVGVILLFTGIWLTLKGPNRRKGNHI